MSNSDNLETVAGSAIESDSTNVKDCNGNAAKRVKLNDSKCCSNMVGQEKAPCETLRVLSWNIDGLDEEERDVRAIAICDIINRELPDVIFLQEVIDDVLAIVKALCEIYIVVEHKICHYFNVIMVKKNTNIVLEGDSKWIHYPSTEMGRFLLYQKLIVYGSQPVVVMTTHLESTKEASSERKTQLKTCFNIMKEMAMSHNVIFAGDINIRESEMKQVKGLPNGVVDAWEACGCDHHTRFTWDMLKNDNLKFPASVKPRARFDRMFYQSCNSCRMTCTEFQLVGMQRIEACGRFASDHFGMLSTFSFEQ